MDTILINLEKYKTILLQTYPDKERLTSDSFDQISDMLQTDFDSISRSSSRLKIVFNCISTILTNAFSHNIQKRYLLDLLNVFFDTDIAQSMKKKLGNNSETLSSRLNTAKAQIIHSQWSDDSSDYRQHILDLFEL